MATPTFDEVWTQWKNLIKIVDEVDDFANSNSPNFLGMLDTLTQSLEGDYTPSVATALAQVRSNLSAILSPAFLQRLYTPFLLELGKVIGAPERDLASLMSRLYDYMYDNNEHLQRRVWSFGSVSAGGSNTGNGTILRLTVDENNFPISGKHAETITFECVRDAQSGADKHEEVFEVRGVEAEPDFLEVIGSGVGAVRLMRAVSARDSNRLLSNPSFSNFAGTIASPTAITDWTVGSDIANFQLSEATYYRDFVGDTTPRSLQFEASDSVSQIIANTRSASLRPDVPYWLQAAVYRPTGVTGNVVLNMGSVSRTVALSSLSTDAWTIVGILSSPGQNCWLKNFNEASLDIKIEVTSLSGGSVYVDDVLFVPFYRFDNHWFLPIASNASPVDFLRDDVFTFADSVSTDRIVEKWLWRAQLPPLPAYPEATQVTAAGGRTLTFADSGTADTITASSGSFVSDGYVAGMTLTVAGTSSNNGTYTLATVSATVLTVSASDSLTNEGPLSATATLDATPSIPDPT